MFSISKEIFDIKIHFYGFGFLLKTVYVSRVVTFTFTLSLEKRTIEPLSGGEVNL